MGCLVQGLVLEEHSFTRTEGRLPDIAVRGANRALEFRFSGILTVTSDGSRKYVHPIEILENRERRSVSDLGPMRN